MRHRTVGRRTIANTTGELTALGFGALVVGSLHRVTPPGGAAATVEATRDAGVRCFNTVPHHGAGLSERRPGAAVRPGARRRRAVAPRQRPRAEHVVSSRVRRLLVPDEHPRGVDGEGFVVRDDLRRAWDFSRDGVLRSLAATLERTGLDRRDLVHLHDPDDHWRQAAEEPLARECPAEGMKYDHREAPPAPVERAGAIAGVCAAHGTSLPAAAIAFPRTHASIIEVTLGMRTQEQVRRNMELHARPVPEGLWDALRDQGLIRSDVPGTGGRGRSSQCL